ncbi:MAG: CBS domain-containing protein [Myxococcota bacterium]
MHASVPMTRRVITIPPELPLARAWKIFEQQRIRHLPVVQAGALVGVLSDRDVLVRSSLVGTAVVAPDTSAGEALSPAPFVCNPDTDVADIVRTMTERKIDAMPVVAGTTDRLVGLVTSTDLMLLLIQFDEARPLPFDFELEFHPHAASA